jgi:hypothetical protein
MTPEHMRQIEELYHVGKGRVLSPYKKGRATADFSLAETLAPGLFAGKPDNSEKPPTLSETLGTKSRFSCLLLPELSRSLQSKRILNPHLPSYKAHTLRNFRDA